MKKIKIWMFGLLALLLMALFILAANGCVIQYDYDDRVLGSTSHGLEQHVVRFTTMEGRVFCTGFVVAPEIVMSAAHCDRPVSHYSIDERIIPTIIKKDKDKDLMLLRVIGLKKKPIAIADYEIQPGEKVLSIGCGRGLCSSVGYQMLDGRYSGEMKDREWALYNMLIHPGQSGSMIVDSRGRVVNLVNMYFPRIPGVSISSNTNKVFREWLSEALREL